MNLLFMANNGLPRNGLVALYDPYRDTYGRNILPAGSENFVTGWTAYSGASVTVIPNQTAPDGTLKAYRIQSSGGTSVLKYSVIIGVFPVGIIFKYKIYVKNNGITNIVIRNNLGNETIVPAGATTNVAISGISDGTSSVQIQIRTSSVADAIDSIVYQPQINIGTLYPYSPPAGLPQSLTDFSGRGNSAQLGSAAGADTNDPAYSGQGLVFGADDYCKSSSPVFDDMSAFTCITVFKPLSAGGANYGRLWDKVQRYMQFNGTNRLAYFQSRISGNDTWEANAGITYGVNYIHGLSVNSTTPDIAPNLYINSTKQSITRTTTGTGAIKADTASDMYIANRLEMARAFDGTIYLQAWYNRVLSDTEYMQAYNYLKRLMNSRGVAI